MISLKCSRVMSVLGDDIVFLRAIEPEDLDLLYEWENDTSLWECSNTLSPYSRFTIKMYIERALREDVLSMGQLRLMICLRGTDRVIGTLDIFDIDTINGRGEMGLFIVSDFRGMGYSGMTIRIAERYARDVLLLHQLYVHIATDNFECIRCFERNGFVRCGLMRDWRKRNSGYADAFIYQKLF